MSEGWHEFITPVKALTRIAYVYESGEVYLPEGGDPDDFVLAASYGRVYRLVREDEAAAQPPAPITAEDVRAAEDSWSALGAAGRVDSILSHHKDRYGHMADYLNRRGER
jgi:hypothetical protein